MKKLPNTIQNKAIVFGATVAGFAALGLAISFSPKFKADRNFLIAGGAFCGIMASSFALSVALDNSIEKDGF